MKGGTTMSTVQQPQIPVLYGYRELDFTPDGSSTPVKGKQFWIGFPFGGNGVGQEVRKMFVSDESVAKGIVQIAPNLQIGNVECRFDHNGKLTSIANVAKPATAPTPCK